MTAGGDWIAAGSEPRLRDILSDPVIRSLMKADHVDDNDFTVLIERVRGSVSPMQFGLPKKKPASEKRKKFSRPLPTHRDDQDASLLAAYGVVSRWIASISDRRMGLE